MTARRADDMLICVYEDRVKQLPGLMLLVHSLSIHCPRSPIRLRFPALPPRERAWLRNYPNVVLVDEPLDGAGSYNVKAAVLLDGLATGAGTCLWLDTDILVNGSLDFIAATPDDVVVTTEDPWCVPAGSSLRCSSFGLMPGRQLAGPLNSAVLKVGDGHEALLRRWATQLKDPRYLAEQAKSVFVRNPLMLGDQDVLSALLASKDFAHIPLHVLKHPTDVLHHHGPGAFGPRQRMAVRKSGLPPLIHAMGGIKPWAMSDRPSSFREYYERMYLETSPYVTLARRYAAVLETRPHWLDVQLPLSRLSLRVNSNNAIYSGMVLAAIHRLRHKVFG